MLRRTGMRGRTLLRMLEGGHWPIRTSTTHPRRLIHEMVEVEMRKDCLTELKLDVAVEYKEGEYPSPSILVNGEDVMGAPASQVASCRLDVPTRKRLLAALQRT